MKEQRTALRTALAAKAFAHSNVTGDSDTSAFVSAVEELKQWVAGPDDLEDAEQKSMLALTLARYELQRHG